MEGAWTALALAVIPTLVTIAATIWLTWRMEKYRNEARASAFMHETRFKTLHERRAEVIAEIYGRIAVLAAKIEYYVRFAPALGPEGRSEWNQELGHEIFKLRDECIAKAIYFPDDLAKFLEDLIDVLYVQHFRAAHAATKASQGIDPPHNDPQEDFDKEFQEKAKPLLGRLRREFQTILGTAAVPAGAGEGT